MRILLIGAGGVGAAFAAIAARRDFFESVVIADYNLERMASHGARRAAEMEESAATLRELGLDPLMVQATVARQREMGAIGKLETVRAALKSGRAAILDAIDAAAKNRH